VKTLGELERAVMNVLWDAPTPLTAAVLATRLPNTDLAATTLLTVLSRLEAKGFVRRARTGRAAEFAPTGSRAAHVAETLRAVLADATDPSAALAHFVGNASPAEADALRGALRRRKRG
jgi:predicted transcriptional regulator